jgi:hypothetical protein
MLSGTEVFQFVHVLYMIIALVDRLESVRESLIPLAHYRPSFPLAPVALKKDVGAAQVLKTAMPAVVPLIGGRQSQDGI